MLALFANLSQKRTKRLKTNEKRILYMCLRNQFCIHIRVRTFYFPKKGQNPCIQYFFHLVQARVPDFIFNTTTRHYGVIVLRCFKTPLEGTVPRDFRPKDYSCQFLCHIFFHWTIPFVPVQF
jgi:hypothetical protein